MSIQTTSTEPVAKPAPERGELMSGAEILVACLEREGVDTIFAYPGGASMHMHQALTQSKKIRTLSAAPRAGRRLCRRRVRARHRPGGRLHGHERSRRDQSRDRHRRCAARFRAAGGDHRPGAAAHDRQGRLSGDRRFFRHRADREAQLSRDRYQRHPAHREGGFLHCADGPAGAGADRCAEEYPAGNDAPGFPGGGEAARL